MHDSDCAFHVRQGSGLRGFIRVAKLTYGVLHQVLEHLHESIRTLKK